MDFLAAYRGQIYALTRIVVGFLFACHGAQKLFGAFGGIPAEMNALIFAAGVIELAGGALIAVGLFTSYAAFLCSGTMAVAYFGFHQSRALFPIENGGEPAALYCWVFLLIAASGDGMWSVGGRRGSQGLPAA
jgi:putative oxidoreductase